MQRAVLALAIGALFQANPAHADEAALQARMEKLAAELDALKAELGKLKQDAAAKAATAPATASVQNGAPSNAQNGLPYGATSDTNAGSVARLAPGDSGEQTTLIGYGELNYNRPIKDTSATQADLRRAVLGFSHRFDDRTRVVSEFEWEHAVVSADDRGEAEVEQLYIEHRLGQDPNTFLGNTYLRAGLFLIPLGILNERHEPPTFYGVERNFVETRIIPSTLREGGLSLLGSTEQGLAWQVGVSTAPDLSKWDVASTEGREAPLASIHQELQFAKARDLQVFGAVNWRGIPGLNLGAGITYSDGAQGTADFAAQNAHLTLWDIHGQWRPGRWDLSAVYARGHISSVGGFNAQLVEGQTPIPSSFWGGYGQVAYKLWSNGDYSLNPFVRYERFNSAATYTGLAQGFTVTPLKTEGVSTVGVNFYLNPKVVFKADYQKFEIDKNQDRFDLGVGFLF